MKKTLLVLFAGMALTACNDSSTDVIDKPQEQTDIIETFETTNVSIQFNLPSGTSSPIMDTQNFTLDDMLSYNASTSTYVCDPESNQKSLKLYLLRIASNKWDVYFTLDDELLDVEGGEIGGTGQKKATLEFDVSGNFIRQIPYIISSTELQFAEINYKIEFDFYSNSTTNFDDAFIVSKLEKNGC